MFGVRMRRPIWVGDCGVWAGPVQLPWVVILEAIGIDAFNLGSSGWNGQWDKRNNESQCKQGSVQSIKA
jgi:hypothetical protein